MRVAAASRKQISNTARRAVKIRENNYFAVIIPDAGRQLNDYFQLGV